MNDKKEFRFNVIDIIIILALCVGIFVFVFCLFGNDISEFTSPKHEVNYILSFDEEFASSFAMGDEILSSNGKVLGNVDNILTAPEILVSVSTTAYEVDEILFVKGVKLSRGEEFMISLGNGKVAKAKCIIVSR